MEKRFEKVLNGLMDLLNIDKSDSGIISKNQKMLVKGLLGKTENKVTIIDIPYTGSRFIVLGAITLNESPNKFVPKLVRTTEGDIRKFIEHNAYHPAIPLLEERGWLEKFDRLKTEEVAEFFVSISNQNPTSADEKTWIPSVYPFFYTNTEGDLGNEITEELNGNTWFDLRETPIGGSVYIIDETQNLYIFTRKKEDGWEVTAVPEVGWPYTKKDEDFGTLLEGAIETLWILRED